MDEEVLHRRREEPLILAVGLAGMAGVMARYAISDAFHGDALPWATVGINVAASLMLGLLVASHVWSQDFRTIAGVGFLGGFSTFSTVTVQIVLDLESGASGRAFAYLAASLLLGLAAAAAGYYLGRSLA